MGEGRAGGAISKRAGTGRNRRGGGNNVTMLNTCNLQSKRAMPEKRKQGKNGVGAGNATYMARAA